MTAIALPHVLTTDDPHRELAKTKQRIAAKPAPRSAVWLYEVQRLGLCLHALGRDDEALAASEWLAGAVTFQGNFNLWTPAGYARCLAARLVRLRGDEASARALVLPLEAHDLYAVLTPDDVRGRQEGLREELRAQAGARDGKLPRLKVYWALSGLLHYRETVALALPHAPHIDVAACDTALAEGLALLGRWLAAKA